MYPLFRLSARLRLCASLVRPGARLIDIGTDHAYLPIWLALQGKISHAFAADINEQPLQSALANIERYGAGQQVTPRLSDGLDAFSVQDGDDIVLAGMGGELMVRILSRTAWLKWPEKRLILQPMTSAPVLRAFLTEFGFAVEQEKAVCEDGHVYSVMQAVYCPERVSSGELYLQIGKVDASSADNCAYLKKRAASLEKKARGLELSGKAEESKVTAKVAEQIRLLIKKGENAQMVCVRDIYDTINQFAPFHTAMSFDNVGLLVGNADTAVHTVLLALDITPEVVQEAAQCGAELVVSHHPVIFDPLKRLPSSSVPYALARHGIAAVCAHTNLDLAEGGVNTCLAQCLKLKNVTMLKQDERSGLAEGLVGETEKPYTPQAFAQLVKETLGCDGLKYTDGKREITRVALCGGAGAYLLEDAVHAGAQAFVTADTKHHELLNAEAHELTLVDAGHFYTEDVVILPLAERLQERYPDVRFIKSGKMHSPAIFL